MDTQSLTPSSSSLLRPFYPALDGLRAVAFLMVFLYHYATGAFAIPYLSPVFAWGWMGVDLFFVLSGFLITGILYDSLHGVHFFKNFYIRRTLRIFPLFYGVWIVLLLMTPFLHIQWTRYNVYLAAYIGNFWDLNSLHSAPGIILFAPSHAGGPPRQLILSHFWSLCVEEQFYLVWPAVVWLVRSRRKLLCISLALVALTPVLRILYTVQHPEMVTQGVVHFGTVFRMDTLFLGAALALWLRGTTAPVAAIRRRASITAAVTPVVFVVGYLLTGPHSTLASAEIYVDNGGFTLIAITCAALILLALDPATRWMRSLQQRPLLFLGRISYGLYIFHGIPIMFFVRAAVLLRPYHLQLLAPVLAFAVTVAVAWLSFRFFESPFLRLKPLLAPQPPTQLRKPVVAERPEILPVLPAPSAVGPRV